MLQEQAVIDLGGQLELAFMAHVPGGVMSMGAVDVNATSNLCTLERTTLEIETHAHATEAQLQLVSMNGHITMPLDLPAVQKLRQMLDDTEQLMLGKAPAESPNADNGLC